MDGRAAPFGDGGALLASGRGAADADIEPVFDADLLLALQLSHEETMQTSLRR